MNTRSIKPSVKKIVYTIYIILQSFIFSLNKVYAKGEYEMTLNPDAHDPDKVAGALGGIICIFAQVVGVGFVLLGTYGVLKHFVLKNSEEIKAKDIVFIFTGALLVSIRIVLQQAGVIA